MPTTHPLSDEHKRKISIALTGIKRKPFTAEHRKKLSDRKKKLLADSKNHPQWKGKKASYRAIHLHIVRRYGQPTTCQKCGKRNLHGRKIHWANISRKYKRIINDWVRLCIKCHAQFDTEYRRKLARK